MPKQGWQLPAFITLCVLTVVGWAPLAGVLLSGLFASAFGCTLNEAGVYPCVVAGIDWGSMLATMFVAGWLMLVTWPLMLLTFVAWIALGILFVTRRMQRRRAHA
jgi:hypothetical protein